MVDISLCMGGNCDHTCSCKRYLWLHKASDWQSYIEPNSCITSGYSAYWEVNQPNPSIGKFRVCSVYVGGD